MSATDWTYTRPMQGTNSTSDAQTPWILRKAVTTLAIAPQTENLTRVGRLAYNVMLKLSQDMPAAEDGGFSAPLSEIVRGFGATPRDSDRVREYIVQMCSTVVRWFPLAASDAPLMPADDQPQGTLAGIEQPPTDTFSGRVFTLLAEARLFRRSGERWMTWYFPPTVRDFLLDPARYAQLNIRELALLSRYASVALAEICSRYLDSPGGLTNRADPEWWMTMLRSGPDTKPRPWRKFKSETLRPALAEINQLMSMEVEVLEFKQGRAVTSVQFSVKRKGNPRAEVRPADGSLTARAESLGIRERDLDSLVDAFGDGPVERCIDAMEARVISKPTEPIANRLAYLKKALRNAQAPTLFDAKPAKPTPPATISNPSGSMQVVAALKAPEPVRYVLLKEVDTTSVDQRLAEINREMDMLTEEELEPYVQRAERALVASGGSTPSLAKRFKAKQYRSPLIWRLIRAEYASEKYGQDWKLPPTR